MNKNTRNWLVSMANALVKTFDKNTRNWLVYRAEDDTFLGYASGDNAEAAAVSWANEPYSHPAERVQFVRNPWAL